MGNHFRMHSNAYHQRSRGIKQSDIVFINGSSCSGKSTLALRLAESMGGRVLHADDYLDFEMYDDDERSSMKVVDGRHWKNWEAANSMNWSALQEAIEEEKRKGGLVFVEGFLLFVEPTILKFADAVIQIEITKEECWFRRRERAIVYSFCQKAFNTHPDGMQHLPKKAGSGETNYEIIEVYTKNDEEMRLKIQNESRRRYPEDGDLAWLHLYFEDVLWPMACEYHSESPPGSMIVKSEDFPKKKDEWLLAVEERFLTYWEVKKVIEQKNPASEL